MSMEQIFQAINKQMLEATYTLRIGQLLKITPNLKKYVAKIKAWCISKPSVATMVETHFEINTIAIEVDN
jgi:hypothetical protein